jgi:hypothetical protein
MTKEEQVHFVTEHCNRIATAMMLLIVHDKIPAAWDGVELRQLLADKFQQETYQRLLNGQRMLNYRNMVAVSSL